MTLCILAEQEPTALALLSEIRTKLYPWFVSLQEDHGGFRMHHDGEVDVRATYCIVSVARLLHLTGQSVFQDKTAAYVASCQTYEGGFGGEPFAEGHGGYTYCATAALQLLGQLVRIDAQSLRGWLARRQMSFEGGFNGRPNKLVDGCYSFWQGGCMAILSVLEHVNSSDDPWLGSAADIASSLLFDQAMLERYVLLCAQDVNGGLRDKPSKPRDFYHSCYNLSGLSVAQHYDAGFQYGHETSRVARTHPCYNIRVERARFVLDYFEKARGTAN
jgi:protein farnesyltransferase subunit beta